ncbi:uncharacterized protein LOC129719950 [Wyeomyia smithii]|uniref:uncharacterized protein LOC129719950 n=1 Tax=Wyeomyia smithii TaxID=174621 RepID=UPI002467ECF7|nr:uncharacterized protein LOC129719950 [Wyeomyia smithii]
MLSDSKGVALERFLKIEKRLEHDVEMKQQYHAVIQEYLDLGHLRKVSEEELRFESEGLADRHTYFLPHHAVIKQSSSTTKVRVVFDGSARSNNGYSLKDALLKGPTIQDELLSLLLRFRKHEVALVADMEKMYRQVRVDANDARLQRIFWRFSPTDPIGIYELLTVTFGLSPSAFLAIRVLHQLAIDEGRDHPKASSALVNDFYVDDYIGGTSSIDQAIQLRTELNDLVSKDGFILRKWCSNCPVALAGIPGNQLGTNLSIFFESNPVDKIKTLGITWEPSSDQLRFLFEFNNTNVAWTRKKILANIAKLFDPLGLIAPIVVSAKILMQQLALLQTGWDSVVPTTLEKKWVEFYNQLARLSELSIDRFVFISEWNDVQIHCFADASELAYGSCLYVRSQDQYGNIRLELLTLKSRVAPLERQTLPRLELCAAK